MTVCVTVEGLKLRLRKDEHAAQNFTKALLI